MQHFVNAQYDPYSKALRGLSAKNEKLTKRFVAEDDPVVQSLNLLGFRV